MAELCATCPTHRPYMAVVRAQLPHAQVRLQHSISLAGNVWVSLAHAQASMVLNIDVCSTTHRLEGMQVRDFQSVIGKETRKQCQEKFGGLPDILMACVGGGSNAMGTACELAAQQVLASPAQHPARPHWTSSQSNTITAP